MDTKGLDHAQRTRDGAIGHDPHHHVHRFRGQRNEIPEGIVGRCRLRKAAIRLHLDGVDQVREFDRVLDEKDGDIVADQIPVPFLGIELDGEPAHIARRIDRTGSARHRRNTREQRRLLAHFSQDLGRCVLRERMRQFEVAMHCRTTRMHDALWNALVVEVRNFFTKDEIFQQRGTARVGPQ